MKKILPLLFACHLLLLISCEEKCHDPQPQPEKNHASGKAVDTKGNPLANAVQLRNKDQAFGASATGLFEPAYQGVTGRYKMTIVVAD